MQCVILSGGLGTRMAPLTNDCPKTLIPIAGKPFAHWQLEWLASAGITDVVYCIGHLADKMRLLGDSHAGIRIRYSQESEPLGKLDAIRLALPLLRPWFFVLYGDSYLDVNLRRLAYRFHLGNHTSRLMTTWDGIDYGISIFRRSVFEHAEFPVSQPWHEIGSPEGFAELEHHLSAR